MSESTRPLFRTKETEHEFIEFCTYWIDTLSGVYSFVCKVSSNEQLVLLALVILGVSSILTSYLLFLLVPIKVFICCGCMILSFLCSSYVSFRLISYTIERHGILVFFPQKVQESIDDYMLDTSIFDLLCSLDIQNSRAMIDFLVSFTIPMTKPERLKFSRVLPKEVRRIIKKPGFVYLFPNAVQKLLYPQDFFNRTVADVISTPITHRHVHTSPSLLLQLKQEPEQIAPLSAENLKAFNNSMEDAGDGQAYPSSPSDEEITPQGQHYLSPLLQADTNQCDDASPFSFGTSAMHETLTPVRDEPNLLNSRFKRRNSCLSVQTAALSRSGSLMDLVHRNKAPLLGRVFDAQASGYCWNLMMQMWIRGPFSAFSDTQLTVASFVSILGTSYILLRKKGYRKQLRKYVFIFIFLAMMAAGAGAGAELLIRNTKKGTNVFGLIKSLIFGNKRRSIDY